MELGVFIFRQSVVPLTFTSTFLPLAKTLGNKWTCSIFSHCRKVTAGKAVDFIFANGILQPWNFLNRSAVNCRPCDLGKLNSFFNPGCIGPSSGNCERSAGPLGVMLHPVFCCEVKIFCACEISAFSGSPRISSSHSRPHQRQRHLWFT